MALSREHQLGIADARRYASVRQIAVRLGSSPTVVYSASRAAGQPRS